MLALTRKEGETIRIGDSIVIQVSQIKGNRVRISIEAPADQRILRGELDPHQEPEKAPAEGRGSLERVSR